MRGINHITLVGNLGRDPELRSSSNGSVSWCAFSVATSRSKRVDDNWVEETDWHRVKVFGTQAELCARHLAKGRLVGVVGSVAYDNWTDKDGNKRYSTVILADRVNFLGAPRQTDASAPSQLEAQG